MPNLIPRPIIPMRCRWAVLWNGILLSKWEIWRKKPRLIVLEYINLMVTHSQQEGGHTIQMAIQKLIQDRGQVIYFVMEMFLLMKPRRDSSGRIKPYK